MWVDSAAGGTGLYCLEVDFATFYQRWLDAESAPAATGEPTPNAYYSFLEYGDNLRYRRV